MGTGRRILVVAASTAVVLLLLAERPAAAHATVESSDPAEGTVIEEPVTEITLVFTDRTEPVGDEFQVVQANGETRSPTRWESPDRRTFVLHFDPPIDNGETGLQWTIRAADSHSLTGGFTFTVDADERSSAALTEPSTTSTTAELPPADLAASTTVAPHVANDGEMEIESSAAVVLDLSIDEELSGSPAMRALGVLGRTLTMAGSLIAIGALVFLLVPLRGTGGEGRLVVLVARRAALAIGAGAIVRSVSQIGIRTGEWTSILSPAAWIDMLATRFGGAMAFLMIGAFGISTGSFFQRVPIGHRSGEMIRADMAAVGALAAGHRSVKVTNHPPLDDADQVGASLTPLLFQWRPSSASSGAVLGVVALVAASVTDGHTLGTSNLLLSAATTSAHVLAGSVWVGGVVVLSLLLRRRFRSQRRIEAVDLAVRYSVLASISLVAVAAFGLVLAFTRIESTSELWTTSWGQLVLAKTALVAVTAAVGALNHFVVIPALVTRTDDVGIGVTLKRLVTAEILILVAVVVLSAQLVATSI